MTSNCLLLVLRGSSQLHITFLFIVTSHHAGLSDRFISNGQSMFSSVETDLIECLGHGNHTFELFVLDLAELHGQGIFFHVQRTVLC